MTYRVLRGGYLSKQLKKAKLPSAFLKLLAKSESSTLTNPVFVGQDKHKLRSPLDSAHRMHVGRLRYFYIFSAQTGDVRGLYVGIRADGDDRDAYEEFEKLLRKGAFDEEYGELGLTHPFMAEEEQSPTDAVEGAPPEEVHAETTDA